MSFAVVGGLSKTSTTANELPPEHKERPWI